MPTLEELSKADGEWSDLCSRVSKLLEPAIDMRAPYAGIMVGAIVDMFMSRLLRQRDAFTSLASAVEREGYEVLHDISDNSYSVRRAGDDPDLEQIRQLLTQHMGWIKQFSFDDPEFQSRNWKDNMMRIRSQLDRMTHDFRVQI